MKQVVLTAFRLVIIGIKRAQLSGSTKTIRKKMMIQSYNRKYLKNSNAYLGYIISQKATIPTIYHSSGNMETVEPENTIQGLS